MFAFSAQGFPNPERFLKERLGFRVVVGLSEKETEIVQGLRGFWMLRTTSALCRFHCSFRNGNRLPIFSLLNQLDYFLVQRTRIILFGQRCLVCEDPEAKC